MKRGLYVTLGVLLLVVGLALAILGTVVALSVGSDDAVSTAPARVHGTGVAVVAEDFRVDTSAIPVPDDLGTLTLTVTGRDGRAMFVGAADAKDIDTYLTGAPYDVVVDLTAGEKATTRKVPGGQQPQPPDSQGFWTAKSSGAPAVLTARISSGSTLVVMNADATPVVDADVVVTLRVAKVWTYSWIAVAIGVLLVLLAVLLFWRARVAGRRRRDGQLAGAQAGTPVAAATVLPGAVPDAATLAGPPTAALATPVSVAPVDDDVVAAPSAALAALVAEAAPPAADDTVELPVRTPEDPVGTEVSPVDLSTTAEGAAAAVAADAPVTGAGTDLVLDDADPLFDEIVAEHGADPVHDELPVGAVAPDPAVAADAPAPTGSGAVESAGTPGTTTPGTPGTPTSGG